MKKISLLFFLIFQISLMADAQTPPNAFNYSAVARDAQSNSISNATIGIQISIIKNSPTGPSQYTENHFVNTDDYGLFNLIIGSGSVQNGSIGSIDWSSDNYYLKVGMDASGGTNFLTMGTMQLLSVPYALYAKNAGAISGTTTENDPIFTASLANNISPVDTSYWNNKQNQLTAGDNISIIGNIINTTSVGGYIHQVGDEFGGGVIFHLYKDASGAEHGLIVDKLDLSTSQAWSNVTQTLIGISAQSPWDGLGNSNAIIQQPGHSSSAALICLNSTNGGQSDWYLPSIQELNLLWKNYYSVSKSLSQISGATVLQPISYLSSTEQSASTALFFYFDVGYIAAPAKGNLLNVRAIRAF